MPAVTSLNRDSSTEDILGVIQRDGAVIVRDIVSGELVDSMIAEVTPYIERTPMGADDFVGRSTQRTGALVARTPSCREFVMHRGVLEAANSFLAEYTERIILHLTQTININPGQGEQLMHRDRLAWGTHMPLEIEPQFNTIWALTDFTASNGATRVVPGSQNWPWERRARADEIGQAEMSAGSVLLYSGSVLHSGGENRSDERRLGLNITYCLAWELEPELQEILGYTQGHYALGYFSDPESNRADSDILPPEIALGRRPRAGQGFSISGTSNEDSESTDSTPKAKPGQP